LNNVNAASFEGMLGYRRRAAFFRSTLKESHTKIITENVTPLRAKEKK